MEGRKKKFDILDILCVAIIVIMFAVVMLQVISRYVFNNVVMWSDEMAKFLLIYSTMFGAVLAEKGGKNVKFEFVVEKLPRTPKLVVVVIRDLLIVAFYILMVVYGIKLSMQAHFMRGVALQAVRWSYIYITIPISFSILLYMHIKNSKKELTGILQSEKSE